MTFWRAPGSDSGTLASGERFAAAQTVGMAGIAVFCWVAVVDSRRVFPLIAWALVLMLSPGFRRRAAWDAGTPRRVTDDDRDPLMTAFGDRVFRVCTTLLIAVFALTHAAPSLRAALLADPLRSPGLLLTGLTLANPAAHAVVWRAYVRDRQ